MNENRKRKATLERVKNMDERGIMIPNQNLFITSDIHGHDEELQSLLKNWNPDNERLLFLGDYCDRGVDSAGAFSTVQKLVESGQALAIGGNHEDLFLSFLDSPNTEFQVFYGNGGNKTIASLYPGVMSPEFLRTPEQWAEMIKRDYADLIQFLKGLPFYIEMEDWLFVHAGVNQHHFDWRETSDTHLRWIREMFYLQENETGKRIMFGHTPIPLLPNGKGMPIWTNKEETIFGIDGGMGSNKRLNGVRIQDGEIKELVVQPYQSDSFVVDKANLFKKGILL